MKFAPSLDTAGLFTATADQMVELWNAMGCLDATEPSTQVAALPVPDQVEPNMRRLFRKVCRVLQWQEVEPPVSMLRLRELVRTIGEYEGARMFRSRLAKLRGTKMGDLIVRGLSIESGVYEEALAKMERARRKMVRFYAEFPVLAWPSALGAAPHGLASTGDPLLQAPFTGLGVPAISIPMPVKPGQLPLGLQLMAASGNDSMMLRTAAEVARSIVGSPTLVKPH
jgi:Asp-tRNA(Asn)/Glu-tRNA(Gln) amidotransferase A subunit family amidase